MDGERSGAPGGIAPARRCAYAVIRRVFEQGAFADRALHGEAARLGPRDRALAVQLTYGTIQRRAALDYVAERLTARPLAQLDLPVLAALRLGLFQLLFLEGIAGHAAVNESVELAKRSGRGGATLVNAVLRRAQREGRALLAALDDGDPAQASVIHSIPEWLADRWWEELGGEQALLLLRRINDPAESALRVNTLVSDRQAVLSALDRLGVRARAATDVAEGIVLEAPFDAHGSSLFAEGAITPQSRASMLVAAATSPNPGERVLDLCAAPGAKTTHLAALMEDRGELVAVEAHAGRARALTETCRRMRARSVRVQLHDAREPVRGEPFDRVLVDPPCSGLGTVQSRPDLRWRVSPEGIDRLAALQGEIVDAAAAAVRRGGILVYSVCTISRREGEDVVNGFLGRHPEWSAEPVRAPDDRARPGKEGPYLQLLPHLDGTDGFFIARLRRGESDGVAAG